MKISEAVDGLPAYPAGNREFMRGMNGLFLRYVLSQEPIITL